MQNKQNNQNYNKTRRGKRRKRNCTNAQTNNQQQNNTHNITLKPKIRQRQQNMIPIQNIQIVIKIFENKIIKLRVHPSDKVVEIMLRIADKTQIPIEYQTLIFRNKQLFDIYNKTLSQYNITNNCTIHLKWKEVISNKIDVTSNSSDTNTHINEKKRNAHENGMKEQKIQLKNKNNEIQRLKSELKYRDEEIKRYKTMPCEYERLKYIIGCDNAWQYKDNTKNTWMDHDEITNDNIEQFDVGDMFEWKQHIFEIKNKSVKLGEVNLLNTETGEIIQHRRIQKMKDVVAKDELIIRDKTIEEQNKMIQELRRSYQIKINILSGQNKNLNAIVETLQKEKENHKEQIKFAAVDMKILKQQLMNLECEKEKFRLEAQKQQKQKWHTKYEIINKDKVIKKVTEEKKKFKLKALEEEKQKVKKELKYKKLKDKIAFSIQWQWLDDDNLWKPYGKDISGIIESLYINGEYNYTYWRRQQSYKITKLSNDTAEQINVKTNVKRKVRRTKIESLLLSPQYPACWDVKYICEAGGSTYATPYLIDLRSYGIQSNAQKVRNRFFESLDRNSYDIIKIEAVQNQRLYDKYWSVRQTLSKTIGENNLNERELFHGTAENVMTLIAKEGFRKEFSSIAMFGKGTYFARDANYSMDYSYRNDNGVYKMFLCRVICGESALGNNNYELTNWPKKSSGLIYDCLVNNQSDPSIFVIHEDYRAYPMYVVHFRRKYCLLDM
eukprot:474085_1